MAYRDFDPQPTGRTSSQKKRSPLVPLVLIGIAAILIATSSKMFESVGAGEYVIKQGVLDGALTVWDDPGPHWQGWGTVTHYPRNAQYWFSKHSDQGDEVDQSVQTRFSDGAHGKVSGGTLVNFPVDEASRKELHRTFGSERAVMQNLVRTTVEGAVFSSGHLVSSTQSFAEKRTEFATFIEDQAKNGRYKTEDACADSVDPVTKATKTVCVTKILMKGATKDPERLDAAPPLAKFNMTLSNFLVNGIEYDKSVVDQINQQQAAIAGAKTAEANARKAEQDALTAKKSGEANAAVAEWQQKTIAAKAVAEADQRKKVAELDKQAAEFKKQEQILLGEGEAARRKLVMQADGALEQNNKTKVEINKVWADAYAKVRPTADIQLGGGDAMQSLGTLMMLNQLRQAGLLPSAPAAVPHK